MKKLLTVWMAIAMVMIMPMYVFAAGGNGSGGGKGNGSGGGSGDGSGGGSGEPLTVESTSIEEGASIGSEDTITLVFSKNVCNKSVRENNQKLVCVTDSEGNPVDIEVILCDDQVEPDKKNDIEVAFVEPLAEGSYTLTAQAGITSKSEAVMAEDFVLNFTVVAEAGEAAVETTAEVTTEAAAETTAEVTTEAAAETTTEAAAETTAEAAVETTAEAAAAETTAGADENSGSNSTLLMVGVVAVVVIAGVAVMLLKKKK